MGGIGQAVTKIGLIGYARPVTDDIETKEGLDSGKEMHGIKSDPVYRSGGLWGLGAKLSILPHGFAGFGRDIIVNELSGSAYKKYNRYMWIHETAHYWQYETGGYANVVGKLGISQIRAGFSNYNPYKTELNPEWIADQISEQLGAPY